MSLKHNVVKVSLLSGIGCLAFLGMSCKQRSYNTENNDSGAEIAQSFSNSPTRGSKTAYFTSPAGKKELCTITKHYPGIEYDDDDAENEAELCSANFYKSATEVKVPEIAVALCPKMSSTFPGVEVYKLDGNDKAKYESTLCKNQDKRPTSRLAKFKQSVSCCYSGSILGYYHLSRILNAGNVPTAVIRTMDVAEHKKLAEKGAAWSEGLNNQLWKQVLGYDKAPSAKANYFTPDLNFIYGVMSDNPTNEVKYSEINKNAGPGTAAPNWFRSNVIPRVASSTSVAKSVGKTLAEAAPVIQQMKDIADLVLLDYLMQQQDRYGNIHMTKQYVYIDPTTQKIKKKRIKFDDNGKIETPAPVSNSVIVNKLLMKDNDCGSRSGNERSINLEDVKKITHMSPRTYKGLQYLADTWSTTGKSFFGEEALMLTTDAVKNEEGLSGLSARLGKAAAALKEKCLAGTLLLDLDLEDHLAGQNTPDAVKALCTKPLKLFDGSAVASSNDTKASEHTPEEPVVVANTPTPAPESNTNASVSDAKSCKVVSTNDGFANVRKGPGTNNDIITTLKSGSSVKARLSDTSPTWYEVEFTAAGKSYGGASAPAYISVKLLTCE